MNLKDREILLLVKLENLKKGLLQKLFGKK